MKIPALRTSHIVHRAPTVLLPCLLIIGGLLVQGCPAGGTLDDPEKYLGDGGETAGSGGGASVCDPTPIFAGCAGGICHTTRDDGTPPNGSVDFFHDGFGPEMVGLPATYANVSNSADCPTPAEFIIDAANIEDSLLLKKVHDTHECGDPMPVGPALSDEDIACLEEWVTDLVANSDGSSAGGATN